MFLRRYTRTKEGKTHTYYALVESVRTATGPRQHIVAYLGELNHDQERRWQRTVIFHNRQGETQQLHLFPDDEHVPLPDDPDIVRIRLRSVGWTNGRRFGDIWLARWLWHFVGLDTIVARHLPQGKHTIRPADIVAIEVINRLCAPCSKFALAEHWYAVTALEDLLGVPDSAVTKDRLYRTLDQLLQAHEAIENDLKEPLGRRRGLARALVKLQQRVTQGQLKKRDKILERIGRLKERFPKATPFVALTVSARGRAKLAYVWNIDKFKAALATDGVYLLRSNQSGWSATEFWETSMQLTVVERVFRILKSHLLLRPIWHHYSGRTQAHVFICVLAYALWKTLGSLAKQAGLQTEIHKPDPRRTQASPQPRPMTPEVILRALGQIQIGDILLETTAGAQLALRRVARPNAEQARILAALKLELPERLSADRLL